jgi:hypothetical protein
MQGFSSSEGAYAVLVASGLHVATNTCTPEAADCSRGGVHEADVGRGTSFDCAVAYHDQKLDFA